MTQLTQIDRRPPAPAGRVPAWTLGDRLRKARMSAGLEQKQLRERIFEESRSAMEVSTETILKYESDRYPTTQQLARRNEIIRLWAVVTGVDFGWLLTGDEDRDDDSSREGGDLAVSASGWTPRRAIHPDSSRNRRPAGRTGRRGPRNRVA